MPTETAADVLAEIETDNASMEVEAIDELGHSSTAGPISVTLDQTAPEVEITKRAAVLDVTPDAEGEVIE